MTIKMSNYFHIEDEKGKLHRYSIPLKWNDLTERQLLLWAWICSQQLSLDHALRAAFMKLCGVPERFFFRLPDSELKKVVHKLKFLFGKNRLSVWVIKKFRFRGVVYHGPANNLANLTIKEFRRTEIYYQHFLKTRDKKHLRLLAATLYRPKCKGVADDDVREALREIEVHKHAKRFEGWKLGRLRIWQLSPVVLQATLLNYEGCRAVIQEAFPKVFVKGSGKGGDGVFDFAEIIDTVAGGALGDARSTEETNLIRFLKHLTRQIESAEEIKRKANA